MPPYAHLDPGAFSFERDSDVGALLLHGFTGTPTEVRALGEHLASQNISVVAPLLPGHGGSHHDLERSQRSDWLDAARAALHDAERRFRRVVVVGQSMGGLLALNLGVDSANSSTVRAVIALAPALMLNRLAHLSRLPLPMRFLPKYEERYPDLVDKTRVTQVWSNSHTPLAAVLQVLSLAKETRARLPSMKTPLLVVQGKRDKTVRPVSAEHVVRLCGSDTKELLWLNDSGHIVAVDHERTRVFHRVSAFIQEYA